MLLFGCCYAFDSAGGCMRRVLQITWAAVCGNASRR